jgi:hypothetical protein
LTAGVCCAIRAATGDRCFSALTAASAFLTAPGLPCNLLDAAPLVFERNPIHRSRLPPAEKLAVVTCKARKIARSNIPIGQPQALPPRRHRHLPAHQTGAPNVGIPDAEESSRSAAKIRSIYRSNSIRNS